MHLLHMPMTSAQKPRSHHLTHLQCIVHQLLVRLPAATITARANRSLHCDVERPVVYAS
jgi:hypothetical protein